mgnify:CR=1 FL=1
MEKKQFLYDKMHVKSLIFIACDYYQLLLLIIINLSIMKIGEEGHNTSRNACVTFLPWVNGDYSCICPAKVTKVHFLRVLAILWLHSWHFRDLMHPSLFVEGVSNDSCSLFFMFYHLLYMYYAWLDAKSCRYKLQVLSTLLASCVL